MKTKKISWQAIAIVVLALVLIASIALGVSGAWFQDDDSATSTATMAEAITVKLADTDGGEVKTFEKTYGNVEALPGDTVLGGVKIIPGSDTQSVIRVKITTEIKDKDENAVTATVPEDYSIDYHYDGDDFAADWATSFNALNEIMSNAKVDTAKWTEQGGYWYYNEVVNSTDDIALFDALTIPFTVNNAAAQWKLSVTIHVDAIQAANLYTETTANNDDWNDLPTDLITKITSGLVRA